MLWAQSGYTQVQGQQGILVTPCLKIKKRGGGRNIAQKEKKSLMTVFKARIYSSAWQTAAQKPTTTCTRAGALGQETNSVLVSPTTTHRGPWTGDQQRACQPHNHAGLCNTMETSRHPATVVCARAHKSLQCRFLYKRTTSMITLKLNNSQAHF